MTEDNHASAVPDDCSRSRVYRAGIDSMKANLYPLDYGVMLKQIMPRNSNNVHFGNSVIEGILEKLDLSYIYTAYI